MSIKLVSRFGFSVMWVCHSCLVPLRNASSLAAVLSVRSSACIMKPESNISAANPRDLHSPRTAASNSLSPDDRDITACVVVAKIGVSHHEVCAH